MGGPRRESTCLETNAVASVAWQLTKTVEYVIACLNLCYSSLVFIVLSLRSNTRLYMYGMLLYEQGSERPLSGPPAALLSFCTCMRTLPPRRGAVQRAGLLHAAERKLFGVTTAVAALPRSTYRLLHLESFFYIIYILDFHSYRSKNNGGSVTFGDGQREHRRHVAGGADG